MPSIHGDKDLSLLISAKLTCVIEETFASLGKCLNSKIFFSVFWLIEI